MELWYFYANLIFAKFLDILEKSMGQNIEP